MGLVPLCQRTPAAHSVGAAPSRSLACKHRQSVAAQPRSLRQHKVRVAAFKVDIEHDGGTTTLEVEEGSTILETALENGLELSHDCKMGVCMTCPARLMEGKVDQSTGMLDEDAKAKGYALLCVSEPLSDCKVKTITEEEILNEVLMT
ncbi:hypothetical protein WJX72_009749 [[Myrmecia] bisecta]|uniref:2Fe-2S ferredoxin-type domain-containing protein n=1 Tax=[Myrmecia] bisecta TaxID=41462 RepID=A0AAW1PQI8_9CHLO